MDSESRLRLISSSNFTGTSDDGEGAEATAASSRVSSFFTLAASWQFRTPQGAKQQAYTLDHSAAIPLSDGHHILFLDNATGLLCLGSDKPLGSVHRLSRKFVFLPPAKTQVKESTFATVYAATSDLSLGARVVVAYGQQIVLYSIPADALKYSTAEQESSVQPFDSPFEDLQTLQLLRHPLSNAPAVRNYYDSSARFDELNMKWVHYLPVNGDKGKSLEDLWPLQISGSVMGSLEGVATLSVQETAEDGVMVWAFSTSGVAKAWRVDDGERPVLSLRCRTNEDGIVGEKTVEIVDEY